MRVAIRADASTSIGTGHIMRCLTLAEKLKSKGAEVVFICRGHKGHLASAICDKGFKVSLMPVSQKVNGSNGETNLLEVDWLGVSWEQDAEETHEILSRENTWDWLVVDHYALDKKWEEKQRNIVNKIMVIDDLANRMHDCDVLLDQNYYDGMEFRYQGKVSNSCKTLLGPKYALIRAEFGEQRKKLRQRDEVVKRILVFFGGVDIVNMTEKTIDAIIRLELEEVVVDVVVGGNNPHKENLRVKCAQLKDVVLHVQVLNMAEMMANADFCIGGGGSTTWERCCLGLPTMAWPIADNQRELLVDSAKADLVYVPDFENPSVEQITDKLSSVLKNPMLRMRMSGAGLEAVDGEGVIRVANVLLKHDVKLRLAELDDEKKLFEWRNDINVRKFSRNTEKINIEQHKKWFSQVLMDPDRFLFIGCVREEEIGVIRFDVSRYEAEISIYLTPNNHGKGYGMSLIEAAESWLVCNNSEVKTIIAEVLPGNKASKKLFEKCGYVLNAKQYRKSIK